MKRTHRLLSLLLSILMLVSLLPVTAFAEETTQAGKAKLIGFAAGQEAGNAYIQNDGMKIVDVPEDIKGKNPMNTNGAVGQTATLSPYCPPYGRTQHPKYVYNDYNATAIIVQDENGNGTQRRLLKGDTFKAGMTYRFTFQDTSWPVTSIIKGGGYLGELTKENFTIEGASVVKVERVAQKISTTEEREVQGFFYNVWIKINGTQSEYAIQYASNNVTVAGLDRPDTSTAIAKTGHAKEGTKITLTAEKSKAVENGEKRFFTGWKFTTTDNNKFYMEKDYIQWYCNVTEYTSNESGSDNVTCSFRMGDKPLKVEALYGRPGSAGVGNVTFNNIKLWVMPPIKGAKGVTSVVPEFDEMGTTYQIGKVEWLEDNETGAYNYLCMDPNKTFDTDNKCYTMRVVLKLKDGYVFSDKGVTITINDKTYGTGAENILYKGEDRAIPVSYNYNETSKSLAIYIPVNGTKTRLATAYRAQAALEFVDVPSIEVTVTRPGSGNPECGSATKSDFTMDLAQGINYSVNVKVKVPKAIQTAIDSGLMQILPQFRYLLNSAAMGTNLWQGSQVTTTTDANGDTIYTYSTIGFGPVAGESYKLVFGTNLVTTGADAQRIAGNIISGTFEGIAAKTISGNITYTSAIRYDQPVTTGITVNVNGDPVSEDQHRYQWQRSSDGTTWTDIAGGTSKQYTPVAGDAYIRLVVTAEGYEGAIYGAARQVNKNTWIELPVTPGLSWSAEDPSNVTVVSANPNQEYIVAYDANVPSSGTWVPGNNENLTLSAKENTTVYVYTRMRADDTHEVGTVYKYNCTYTGTVTEVTGLILDKDTIDLRPGAVESVTVKLIPEDASNASTAHVTWYVNGDTENTIKFYSDEACTTEITKGTDGRYSTIQRTVYVKGSVKISNATLCAQISVGGSSGMPAQKVATCAVNVADAEGNYDLVGVMFTPAGGITAAPGDTVVVGYTTTPVSANLPVSGWALYKGDATEATEMSSDEFAVDISNRTITIKIPSDRKEGIYNYKSNVTIGGTYTPTVIVTVKNNIISIEFLTLTPSSVTMSKRETVKLTAVKTPVNAPGDITWSSDNESVATVDNTGMVTAVANGTATITATCGGKTKTCMVTVHTHDFDRWTYLNDAVHYHKCDCGVTKMEAHNWVKAGEVEATTTATGSITYKCSGCGAEKIETTPKLPETVDPGKPDQPTRPTQPERPNRRPGSGSGTGSTTKPNKDVKSGNTGDAGIALYAGLALLSVTGGAWTFARKRKENDK